jgi:hypothetical protein
MDAWIAARRRWRRQMRVSPHVRERPRRHADAISDSLRYPVLFCHQGEPPLPGSLAVEHGSIVVSGGAGVNTTEIRLQPHTISALRTSRTAAERLSGYPVLVIERHAERPLLVAPLGAGLLAELADLLASLGVETSDSQRVTVVLPLKPHSRDHARTLIQQGPPFPAETIAGTHHAVYLDHDAVVFVFDGPRARGALQRLLRSPSLWRASLLWRDLAAARPYTTDTAGAPSADAELLYSTARRGDE